MNKSRSFTNAIIVTFNSSHLICISLYGELLDVVQRGILSSRWGSWVPNTGRCTKPSPARGHQSVGAGADSSSTKQDVQKPWCCIYTLQQEGFPLKPFPRGLKINSSVGQPQHGRCLLQLLSFYPSPKADGHSLFMLNQSAERFSPPSVIILAYTEYKFKNIITGKAWSCSFTNCSIF